MDDKEIESTELVSRRATSSNTSGMVWLFSQLPRREHLLFHPGESRSYLLLTCQYPFSKKVVWFFGYCSQIPRREHLLFHPGESRSYL
jgi:hypothetical protein